MIKHFLLVGLFFSASVLSNSYADDMGWHKTTIQAIHTRANGNVAFRTSTPAVSAPCSIKDAWEIHRDTNFKENVSIILAAYSSKSEVRIRYPDVPCEPWGHNIVSEIMIGDFWQ